MNRFTQAQGIKLLFSYLNIKVPFMLLHEKETRVEFRVVVRMLEEFVPKNLVKLKDFERCSEWILKEMQGMEMFLF